MKIFPRTTAALLSPAARQWRAEPGEYDILVGRSSEHRELRGKLTHRRRGAGSE